VPRVRASVGVGAEPPDPTPAQPVPLEDLEPPAPDGQPAPPAKTRKGE